MRVQIKSDKEPGRNELCPCGNGLKYKYCHGDPVKQVICTQAYNFRMKELIWEEKIRRGMMCKHGVDKGKHCKDCAVGD